MNISNVDINNRTSFYYACIYGHLHIILLFIKLIDNNLLLQSNNIIIENYGNYDNLLNNEEKFISRLYLVEVVLKEMKWRRRKELVKLIVQSCRLEDNNKFNNLNIQHQQQHQ
jgi:hypothetical protein